MSRQTRLVVGVSLAVLLWSCGNPRENSDSSMVLRRGLAGEPATLDPASAADNFSFQVLQDLYEGLTVESSSGDVLPGVASSWTVDATGTKYTFNLRHDARWSN